MSNSVCDLCGFTFVSELGVTIHKAMKHKLLSETIHPKTTSIFVSKIASLQTSMAPDNYTELKMCRVCLALDVKMYDMKDFKLSEMFQNITGILASHKKNKIYHICWECAARLAAAAAFRDKALLSDALLKDLVHIQLSDITSIKDNYSYLKSSLTVQTISSTTDIVHTDSILNTKDIGLKFNNDTDIKVNKTVTEMNQEKIECEDFEPWIEVPIKVEIEPDPIAENNINIEEQKPEIYLETTLFSNETQDHEDEKPILDVIESHTSSSGEDTEDDTLSNEVKEEMSSNVGTMNRNVNIRINDKIKEKIIELKKNGAPAVGISRETGVSQSSINGFWRRYCQGGFKYRRSTPGQFNDTVGSDTEAVEVDEELTAFTTIENRRLRKARLKHILMTAPVTSVEMKQRISKHKELHDDLKQRIIALKQEGMPTRRVACLLHTSRNTVRKWWARWCDEGHMDNFKVGARKRRKTTPQEDQRLIDRVTQEQSVHTPTLAKELGISTKCVINRLKEAGFRLKQKKASVPLRSGRSHKVDEDTKQQIISMKQNGISVTEIANQFRVTRTSVYLWWRRWCKENNINVTSDHSASTATEHDLGVAEDGNIGNTAQPPIVISSYKSVWQKLPDVEFVS